jgi:hypothetical protein
MPGDEIELVQNAADHLVGPILLAQAIELGQHFGQGSLDLVDGAGGVVLALRLEAALASLEFFTVERGQGVEDRFARRTRIS